MSKGGAIRWSEEQLTEFQRRNQQPIVDALGLPASRLVPPSAPAPLEIPTFAPKAQVARDNAKAKLQALGRLRDGHMNKTEEAYERHLAALKHDGVILWYKFEGIKLRLADRTHFTVDFAVLTCHGILQMVDVKGAKAIVQDDARAKIKIAAELYPFEFFMVYPQKKAEGGGWITEQV